MQISKGICCDSLHKHTTVDFCPVKDLLKPEEKKYFPLKLKKIKKNSATLLKCKKI